MARKLRVLVIGIASIIAAAGCSGSLATRPTATRASVPASTTGSAADLLAEINHIFDVHRQSTYSHHTHVDESTGTYDVDCSGLLDYALQRVNTAAYRAIPVTSRSSARPLAQDIYAAIIATGPNHWQRVTTPAALRPGDVIAWLRPQDNDTTNTGHVLIVDAAPRANPTDPSEYLVTVVDSTETPHADDTRPSGTTGVGRGTIGIVIDRSGTPIAYRWRGGISTHVETTPIAFGRLTAGT